MDILKKELKETIENKMEKERINLILKSIRKHINSPLPQKNDWKMNIRKDCGSCLEISEKIYANRNYEKQCLMEWCNTVPEKNASKRMIAAKIRWQI